VSLDIYLLLIKIFNINHTLGGIYGDSGGPLITYINGKAYQIVCFIFIAGRQYSAPDVTQKFLNITMDEKNIG